MFAGFRAAAGACLLLAPLAGAWAQAAPAPQRSNDVPLRAPQMQQPPKTMAPPAAARPSVDLPIRTEPLVLHASAAAAQIRTPALVLHARSGTEPIRTDALILFVPRK